MKITLGGDSKSGKGELAKRLSEHYGLVLYDVGQKRREAAAEKGMTLSAYNAWSAQNKEGDTFFDTWQKQLATQDNILVDSRLGFYFISESIKIYLQVDPTVGAQRYLASTQTRRAQDKGTSVTDMVKQIQEVRASDIERYMHLYGIDPYSPQHYDIVVDTTSLTVDEVEKIVIQKIDSFYKKKRKPTW
jgi:cytidylate kinase